MLNNESTDSMHHARLQLVNRQEHMPHIVMISIVPMGVSNKYMYILVFTGNRLFNKKKCLTLEQRIFNPYDLGVCVCLFILKVFVVRKSI